MLLFITSDRSQGDCALCPIFLPMLSQLPHMVRCVGQSAFGLTEQVQRVKEAYEVVLCREEEADQTNQGAEE